MDYSYEKKTFNKIKTVWSHLNSGLHALLPAYQPVVKLSITTCHAMQIYNCLGQLRQINK